MENGLQIVSASVSDRGLSEKRPQNEDSYLEVPHLGLFAVADGVGGAEAGEVASQMAMEILGEAFANVSPGSDAEHVMRMAIERANGAIFQMSGDLPQLSMMATTIVALQISGNIATIGHVGDSRLYRLDTRGSLYRETQDHSVVEEEVRAGRMTAAQAANHPSRNVISRALGAESSVEVDMKTIMFEPNSVFMLCSDGITRHISDFEIRELLIADEEPARICERMKNICYERGAEDNLTAVIIKARAATTAYPAEVPETTRLPELEEATVASARPEPVYAGEDAPTTPTLEMTPEMEAGVASMRDSDEQYLMIDEEPAPAAFAEEEPPPAAASESFSVATDSEPTMFGGYGAESPKKSGGALGKILGGLLLLVIGAAIGIGGYLVARSYFAPIPDTPVLEPQSVNITKTAIEKLRGNAVLRPAELIRQFEMTPPADAADFFVLGKAYLSQKRYQEAVRNFVDARNRLKDVPDAESRTLLAAEITQGLVSAQNKEIYERELAIAEPPSASNSNSNAR